MSPRLISWCLGATGFLAALTVFTWPGRSHGQAERVQPQSAVVHWLTPLAADHHEHGSSLAQAPVQAPETVPATLILPLPPATQPEPDPIVQPVPDDEPTVDDLPARQNPTEPDRE